MGETYVFGTNRKITGDYDKSLAVKCASGTYVGSLDDGVLSFKGIRYALPPVGKLRWHEPVPVPDSDEVFEAKYYSNACPQLAPHLPTPKNEDCLMLNIWTDPNGLNEKKPVMVWIHGGAFVVEAAGDYLYHGHNFGVAHKDEVVLVSIEYRLGVLGFVHFEEMFGDEYKNSANLGLYDQIEALRWIKKNISAFGGDPDNVTIFGESAGAGSTSLLSISPLAQGLFKRSIAQSGASGFAGRKGPGLKVAREWVEKKGCKTIEELLALPAEELYDCPQVGPSYPSEILPYNSYEEMYEAWRSGLGKNIDHLSGTNENEMAYFILTAMDPYLFMQSELAIHEKRRSHIGEEDLWRFDKLMEVTDGKDVMTPLLRMTNDLVFHVQQYSQVIAHGDTEGTGKNYMYYCTTESHHNPKQFQGFNIGACHAVEVSYVLNNLHWPEVSGPNQSQEFADEVQQMWINFAKTGDPSIPGLEWPEFTKENWNVMVLDDGRKGGCRVDNTALKAEMELALPLGKYSTMEEGL